MSSSQDMISKIFTDERRTLGAMLRRTHDWLVTEVYRRLGERGFPDLRPAHSAVFRTISEAGTRTTELASAAKMTKQSMSYLVEDLVKLGYAELSPDPHDRRAKIVRLTARGSEAQETALQISTDIERSLARQVGESEYRQMRDTLERVFDCVG